MAKHVFKQWMFFLIKLFIPSCPFQEPRPTLSEIENSQTVDVDKIYNMHICGSSTLASSLFLLNLRRAIQWF